MSYRVEHTREDHLLTAYTEELEPNLAGTYIDRVTNPYYRLLLNFISTQLQGEYESKEEVEQAMIKWPDFVREQTGGEPHNDWDQLFMVNNNLIAAGESLGGYFVVAQLSLIENDE